jgi:hypothetical protein
MPPGASNKKLNKQIFLFFEFKLVKEFDFFKSPALPVNPADLATKSTPELRETSR